MTDEGLRQLARAARVELGVAEFETLRAELEVMLAYAARLADVELGDTPEWTPPVPEGRPLRADEPDASLPRAAALALAPATQDGYFRVPRTLDEG